MSSSLSKIKQFLVWIFIVGLSLVFIISFTLPGGGVGHQTIIIGEVEGRPIKTGRRSKFVWYYQQFITDLQEKGVVLDDHFERLSKQQAFKTVAEQMLLMDYAVENRFFVSDEEVLSAIKRNQFVSEEGVFRDDYYDMFRQRGSTMEKIALEDDTRDQLYMRWLLYSLFDFTPVSDSEIQNQLEANQYRKSLLVAYLNLSEFFEEVIEKDELKNYYMENQTNYGDKNFEDTQVEIEADFINENTLILEEKLKTKYGNILTSKRSDFAKDFIGTANSLGMSVYRTSPLGYFDTDVKGENSRTIGVLSYRSFIRKALLSPLRKVSTPITFSDSIAMVIATFSSAPSLKNLEVDSTTKKRIIEDLQRKKRNRLQEAFRNNLYNNADIISHL